MPEIVHIGSGKWVNEGLAERLAQIMREGAIEALTDLGNELAKRTIADIPIGAPHLDPNPEYALRDHVHVRQYGNIVAVTVEGAYAVKQHEALHFRHPRGGFPKFLERNVVVIVGEMEGKLAGVVQRKFASGKDLTTGIGGRPR
jgi:hypothetical protein